MKKYLLLFSIFILLFIIYSFTSQAEILTVPTEFPTIQSAITASQIGDTVLVQDGEYYENLTIRGHGLTLASLFIIDGDTLHIYNTQIVGALPGQYGRCLDIDIIVPQPQTCNIIGLTFTHGRVQCVPNLNDGYGGAIRGGNCEIYFLSLIHI